MCNRYSIPEELSEVAIQIRDFIGPVRFRIPEPYRRRFNIGPMQRAPVIFRDGDEPVCELLRWGLLPAWAKEEKLAYSTFNARSEELANKPAYRSAFKSRRCLVPADGYYEFQETGPRGKVKVPHRFVMKSGKPFVFAGLWESWRARNGDEPLCTFSIVTTEANEVVRPVHNRMPVILPPEACATWLDPDNKDLPSLESLLKPYPAELMRVYEVNRFVNNVRNEGPMCIEPAVTQSNLNLNL